jgi:hypothetical protein
LQDYSNFYKKTNIFPKWGGFQEFRKIVSMKELYMEMRKELALFTDPLILQFFETGVTEELLQDSQFLLLISNDKVDTWLFKWLMKLPQSKITQLGLIA